MLAKAFPFEFEDGDLSSFSIPSDPYEASQTFGSTGKSPFKRYGVMSGLRVLTNDFRPTYDGLKMTLGDILVPDSSVPEQFFVSPESL